MKSKILDRIFKAIKFRLINLVNKNYIPRQIYIFFFVYESKHIKRLEMINNLYVFHEIINGKKSNGHFQLV